MTTTHAHTDPGDTTCPPGIIAAIPARPILVTEPHVPDMVLKMLQYQLSSVGTAVQCMKLTAKTRLLRSIQGRLAGQKAGEQQLTASCVDGKPHSVEIDRSSAHSNCSAVALARRRRRSRQHARTT